MTSIFSYNLIDDFTSGINLDKLKREIKNVLNIISSVSIHGDSINIRFSTTLSSQQQSLLSDLISNHDPTADLPFSTTISLDSQEENIVTHFIDPDYKRKILVQSQDSDTFDNSTFTINSSNINDFINNNPTITEFSETSFNLKASSYVDGSDIANTGTATSSTFTNSPNNAIDGNINTFWYNSTSESPVGAWWKINFGSPTEINSIGLQWYSTTYYSTDISIEYSNDDINWTLAGRDQSISYTSSGQSTGYYKFDSFSSPIFAQYFRLTFNTSINSTYVVVRLIQFFTTNAVGFPTNDNCTIYNDKNNRQIDTTYWKQINSCSIDGRFPANTITKILLSFDNQLTWVYWNGTQWSLSSLANIVTSYMSNSTFNTLTNTEFSASNGLNSSTKTIDVAINIASSISTASPVINKIVFNVTTSIFYELINNSNIRIRLISPTKTEFKNSSELTKTFLINIDKDD
tara:strand:+ start:1877 stop:3262 length:1386 start_codon:yes stop_codon:yes gene_type:complete